jgi:hypothetical protein
MLEAWCVGQGSEYDSSDNTLQTPEGRLHRLNNLKGFESDEFWKDVGINMRALPGMYHLNVARFYRIPYISITDALYPAFTRHYISNNITEEWEYNQPGCHLPPEGWKYVVDKIIIPFLINQLNNNRDDNIISKDIEKHHGHNKDIRNIYDHRLRMHHPSVYEARTLEYWSTWSIENSDLYAFNYRKIFPQTEYWNHTMPPNYKHKHYGFCSQYKDTHARGIQLNILNINTISNIILYYNIIYIRLYTYTYYM